MVHMNELGLGVARAAPRYVRTLARLAAMAMIVTGTCVVAFYKAMGAVAIQQSQSIGMRQAKNSIQHAYAAAETYAVIRALGAPEWVAEKATIKLGFANEYYENTFKRHKDPTREVYKDIFNNFSGITAARFAEYCPSLASHRGRLAVITKLAEDRALPFAATDARLPPLADGADVRAAIRQFKSDKNQISAAVSLSLESQTPNCSIKL